MAAPDPDRPPEPDTLRDVECARRAQAEDASAWNRSWQRLSERVQAFLRHDCAALRLPPEVEFEDLLSAVLVRMLRDLPQLRLEGRTKFWAWVRRLAKNQVADEWRRHRRQRSGGGRVQQQHDSQGIDLVAGTADRATPSASGELRALELEGSEASCVQRLDNEQARRVYVLRRSDVSFEEIASAVGHADVNVTRVVFSRAKKKVIECLERKLDRYQPLIDRV